MLPSSLLNRKGYLPQVGKHLGEESFAYSTRLTHCSGGRTADRMCVAQVCTEVILPVKLLVANFTPELQSTMLGLDVSSACDFACETTLAKRTNELAIVRVFNQLNCLCCCFVDIKRA